MHTKYTKKIIELLKLIKQSYYQKKVADHKKIQDLRLNLRLPGTVSTEKFILKKQKRSTQVSGLAADGKTYFNSFFNSRDKHLQKSRISNPTSQNLFCTIKEKRHIIKTLKYSQIISPFFIFIIPTKVLKIAKNNLVVQLSSN